MKYLMIFLLPLCLFGSDDEKLILLAYESGLKPVPKSFESLQYHLGGELSLAKIALGKKLFFDKNLSLKRDINCASCHSFDKGGVDGLGSAIGHLGQENPFHLNAPTVFNTAFSKKLFWDGRSDSLQDQAKGPLQAPFEMSITPRLAEQRIRENREYPPLFQKAYGSSDITFETIADVIASYEKTLLTRGRYDDFLLGDVNALNQSEKKGLKLFITKGCAGCHNGRGLGGQVLRKFPLSYHKIWSMSNPKAIGELIARYQKGLVLSKHEHDLLKEGFFQKIDANKCTTCHIDSGIEVKKELIKTVAFPFENRGGFLGAANKYFRVPLLRNVVKTKPYFHNGSVEKLEDAIRIMGIHQVRTKLTDEEVKKIVDFFKAVDGALVDYL